MPCSPGTTAPSSARCFSVRRRPTRAAQLAHRRRVEDKLQAYNAAHTSSSECIRRALLVFEPPSLDAGETTDKGYINQRRVLERRAALVDAVHAEHPAGEVLVPNGPGRVNAQTG